MNRLKTVYDTDQCTPNDQESNSRKWVEGMNYVCLEGVRSANINPNDGKYLVRLLLIDQEVCDHESPTWAHI